MASDTQQGVLLQLGDDAIRAMRAMEDEDADSLIDAYNAAVADIREIVKGYVRSGFGEGGTWTLQDMTLYGRDVQMFQEISERLAMLLGQSSELLGDSKASLFRESVYRTAHMMDQATPPNVDIQLPQLHEDEVRRVVGAEFKGATFDQRLGIIHDGAAADVRDELRQSMVAGEDAQQAADRVSGVMGTDEDEGWLARIIGVLRTEAVQAMTMGRELAYAENDDYVEEQVWYTYRDGRVCQWCEWRDGLTLDQIEKNDDADDEFDNDTSVPLHPYCRCITLPVMTQWSDLGYEVPEGIEPNVRMTMNPETGRGTVEPVEDYGDWAKRKGVGGEDEQ